MKKLLIFCCCISLYFGGATQSLDRSVIGSAGETTKQGDFQLDWTLGETAISTYSHSEGQITEGFHQPYISVLPISEQEGVTIRQDARFVIFPNPTSAKVQVRATLEETETVHLFLFDALGRQVMPVTKTSGQLDQALDLETYQAGTYLLIIRDEHGSILHHAKIVKHQ